MRPSGGLCNSRDGAASLIAILSELRPSAPKKRSIPQAGLYSAEALLERAVDCAQLLDLGPQRLQLRDFGAKFGRLLVERLDAGEADAGEILDADGFAAGTEAERGVEIL